VDELELGGKWGALYSALEFEDHTRVKFYGYDFFDALEELHCQVAGTWTDFENDVGALEAALVDDGLDD